MPTLCIHSKSCLMPSLEMFPFIQCHHTLGRALSGGFSKPAFNGSTELCAKDMLAAKVRIRTPAAAGSSHVRVTLFLIFVGLLVLLSFRMEAYPEHRE